MTNGIFLFYKMDDLEQGESEFKSEDSPDFNVNIVNKAQDTLLKRQKRGHPYDTFKRIAVFWSIIFDKEVTVEQVSLCMMALKMARLIQDPYDEDSLVDIVGYAQCYQDSQRGRDDAVLSDLHASVKDEISC